MSSIIGLCVFAGLFGAWMLSVELRLSDCSIRLRRLEGEVQWLVNQEDE